MPAVKHTNRIPRTAPKSAAARRRGSFLVFVVGALSLLTVAVVAYVAVGSSDRRTSKAIETRAERSDTAAIAADYFAKVISDDLFEGVEQPSALGRTLREVTDYPYTAVNEIAKDDITNDPTQPASPLRRFTPAGAGTDPWLASTEPTWLNPLRATEPSVPELPFLDRQDWGHISNFSPTGRFVNLANLRDNFNAEPGAGGGGGNNPWRMSDRLTLALPNIAITADLEIQDYDNQQATAFDTPFNLDTDPDSYRPAFFSRWQQSAFRPMVDPDETVGNVPISFATPESIFNQWADTDGDGFADSRWIELTDFVDPDGNIASNDEYYDLIVPRAGGLRWFFAARAIDLSGLVNVNTASDFRRLSSDVAEARAYPAGATPADIDLHRLMTLQDTHWDPAATTPAGLFHYDAFEQPLDGTNPDVTQPGYYGELDGRTVRLLGVSAGDYGMLPAAAGAVPADIDQIQAGVRGRVPFAQPRAATTYAASPGAYGLEGFGVAFNPAHRARTYLDLAVPRAFGQDGTPADRRLSTPRGFGTASLLELLTYRGVNDPSRRSPLEAAVGGRFDGLRGGSSETAQWSPLRDNRSLALERGLRDGDGDSGFSEFNRDYIKGRASARSLAHAVADIRQRLTTLSGARPLVSNPSVDVATVSALTEAQTKANARAVLEVLSDGTASDVDRQDALERLFLGYADALLPFSDYNENPSTGAWDAYNVASPSRFLSYGYRGAETALSLTAHVVANMIDLYDDPATGSSQEDVTAFTVVVDNEVDNYIVASADDDWTAIPESPGDAAMHLDVAIDRIASGLTTTPTNTTSDRLRQQDEAVVYSKAFNVYGLEAHPVITRASLITAYTDAPRSLGGDPDWDLWDSGTAPDERGDATIDTALDPSNADLLFRVLAVQVTNPYERTLEMWDDDGFPLYYMEFAGKFYALTDVAPDDASDPSVRYTWNDWRDATTTDSEVNTPDLAPGETRVYMILGMDPEEINDELHAMIDGYSNNGLNEAFGFGTEPFVPVNPWVRFTEQAFRITNADGSNSDPVLMPQIQPFGSPTFTGSPETGNQRIVPSGADAAILSSVAAANQQVLLWRRVVETRRGESVVGNHPFNDILVDRLRQKTATASAHLSRGLTGGEQDVSANDAIGDPLETGVTYNPNEPTTSDGNLGRSIVVYASISRAFDSGPEVEPGDGGLPLWMVEAKNSARSLNTDSEDNLDVTGGLQNAIEGASPGSGEYAYTRFGAFLATHFGMNVDGETASEADYGGMLDRAQSVGTGTSRTNLYLSTFKDLIPEHHIVDNEFEWTAGGGQANALRVGDMLLPLAIGPRFDPYAIRGTGDMFNDTSPEQLGEEFLNPSDPARRLENLDLAWTTTGEAMAVALGFELDYDGDGTPTATTPAVTDATHPLDFIGTPVPTNLDLGTTVTRDVPVLDRAQLTLDAFVPFLDVNNDGLADAGEFVGDGVPLAMGVLDRFTVFDEAYGSLTRAMPGLININTATVEVLRTLPMLSPLNATDPSGTLLNQWDWDPQHDRERDIAAAVAAYRDKARAFSRYVLDGTGALDAAVTQDAVDFAGQGPAGPTPPPDDPGNEARRLITQVPLIRETPGFASLGELLAVRQRGDRDNATGADARHDLDRLGFEDDDINNGTGSISVLYEGGTAESLSDDYDERFLIANALSNVVTVRSDYFAVWFVVHGYGPGDVEGLAEDQPMTPTVQRRYLLVLDRSNVVRQGQKPRVVLFQELPL